MKMLKVDVIILILDINLFKKKINEKNINLKYVSTNDILDPITKPASGINIKKFINIIFNN